MFSFSAAAIEVFTWHRVLAQGYGADNALRVNDERFESAQNSCGKT
jgi:hypothetical protein